MARLNSVVARTFPRTDRAGVRSISVISAFKIASALFSLATLYVPVLLQLLDHTVGNENLDPWQQGFVSEKRAPL
jgi:hypothetical protein